MDREKVIRLIKEEISVCESVNQCYRTIDLPALRDILTLLKEQPEIVRCKDCINKECFGRDGKIVCDLDGFLHDPDWFCADGEMNEGRSRKADDTIPRFDDSTGRMSEL